MALYPDLEIITALLGTEAYGRNPTANAVSFEFFTNSNKTGYQV